MRNVSNWLCRYLSESDEWEYLLDTEGSKPCWLIVMWEIQKFSGVTVKRQNRNGTGHPPQYFPKQVQQTQTNLWVCCCSWGLSGIFTHLNCTFQMQTKLFTQTDDTLNYWIELEWDDPSFSLSTLYLHAHVSRSCFFSLSLFSLLSLHSAFPITSHRDCEASLELDYTQRASTKTTNKVCWLKVPISGRKV